MADVASDRRPDDRGVSTALGYTLNLAVATLLVTGLLVAAGGLVQDERERAIRTELGVVGERVAADLAAADRMSRTGSSPTVRIEVDLPRRVANAEYSVAVNESGQERVVLSTTDPAVSVRVPFRSLTPVAAGTTPGGTLVVTYNQSSGRLEVSDE